MKAWKLAALFVSGGLLLQFGGCAGLLVQYAIGAVANGLLNGVLSALLGSAAA
jgi:hypothetical protein